MKICFFSNYHIGDSFFAHPYIKWICENNKDITFFLLIFCGYELFIDIPNLKKLQDLNYNKEIVNGNSPEFNSNLDKKLLNMIQSKHRENLFTFNYNNENYIAFNIWCVSLGMTYEEDLNTEKMQKGFYDNLNKLNEKFKLNIVNKYISNFDILPSLIDVDITKFFEWYNTTNKKKVFIYNYKPRSLYYHINIDNVVFSLVKKYTNINFIVAMYQDNLKNLPNVKFCDIDFECKKDISCKNLLMEEKISRLCDIVIMTPTGSAMFFLNKNILNYNNKKYMLENEKYTNKLNSYYNYCLNSNIKIIENINYSGILKELDNLLI